MSVSKKIISLGRRIAKGEYGYIFKRIFPGGNMLIYVGRHYVLRLSDLSRFRSRCTDVSQYCDHEVVVADREELARLCIEFGHKAEKFRKRFGQGDLCFLAKKGGEISAYAWAKPPSRCFRTNSLWRFVPERADGAWCFDVYVKPDYRRQGVFSRLVCNIYQHYRAQGADTLYCETYYTNHQSLKSHLSLGYEVVRDVRYVSILGLKAYFVHSPEVRGKEVDFCYSLRVGRHKL